MPAALDDVEARTGANLRPCGFDFFNRAETVAGAVHEKCGRAQGREMFGAQFVQLPRRMQWVRQQHQRIGKLRVFGCGHARLSASVALPAEPHRCLGRGFAQCFNRLSNALAVARRPRWVRRAARTGDAVGKIEAQHHDALSGECFRDGEEQRRVAIGSRAVCERERSLGGRRGGVQPTLYAGRFNAGVRHAIGTSIGRIGLTLTQIEAARERLRSHIAPTPLLRSETLSRECGTALYLKLENLNVTGSYKERGALNAMLAMSEEQRARGVIAASAGNHAQAVAYHAGRLGVRALIYMPQYTPMVKVAATRGWGAEVVLHGENFDESLAGARRRGEQDGFTFLHAFNDPDVMAGQGTVGLELLEQLPGLEAVVVPVGGGGLIAGIACAVKESRPDVRVIGVEPLALPSMTAALREGKPVQLDAAPTIADGAAVRLVGDQTFGVVQRYVDEMVAVDDEEVARAILRLLEKQKMLAEGAGALAVAALLHGKTALRDRRTVALVSGGNIDVLLLSHIIERGLVKDGRLVRLRITLPDRPGGLEQLTGTIARERGNIVQAVHDRTFYGVHLGEAQIDLTVETRGADHAAELMQRLSVAGYRFERVL